MLAREKWQIETVRVLDEVFEERVRQEKRYGHVNDELYDGTGPEVRWLLGVEDAMPAKEIAARLRTAYEEFEAETGHPTWLHLVLEEVAESFECDTADRLEEELLQVAALCVSWVERLRKRGAKPMPEAAEQ